MANNDLKTASVLAFERKLDPSDALFSAGRWDDRANGVKWPAIVLREKAVRGTISNRLSTKDQDPVKLDASIQSPNLQRVDVATLPNDSDSLRVRFTLRILGGAGTPSSCNNSGYQKQLQETVQKYINQNGFGELAYRYAYNLANGRFLWRNRIGAEQIEVQIRTLGEGDNAQAWTFNAYTFSLRNFNVADKSAMSFQSLVNVINQGLAGEKYALLEVTAYARIGDGQEVYPSQELVLDKGEKKGQKSKTLYSVGGVAAMHSQKIGNAIRTIDTWYTNESEPIPIAIEPYGSVTSQGKAYRQPKQKIDFYNLMDKWVLRGQTPDDREQHFVMATLIRGGVFGEKEKD